MKRLCLITATVLLITPTVWAQGIGTVYMTSVAQNPEVLRVSSSTGLTTTIGTAGSLTSDLFGVAIGPNGDIFVTNLSRVIKINPSTGAQTIVSQGGNLTAATGIAVVQNGARGLNPGDIYVVSLPLTAATLASNPPKVVRIDPSSGAQTVISSGGLLYAIYGSGIGLAIGSDGNLYANSQGTVMQIDPSSGFQTQLATNVGIQAIAVDAAGEVVVPSFITGSQLLRINPSTGKQTTLTVTGLPGGVNTYGLASDASGNILALIGTNPTTLYSINPTTGAPTALATGLVGGRGGIAVYTSGSAGPVTSATASTFHVFPQIADGQLSDGSSYRTTLMISNPSSSAPSTCTVNLYGLTINGLSSSYTVAAGGWMIQESPGTQSFQSGYATFQCTASVEAQMLYSFYSPSGVKLGEATVFSSPSAPSVGVLADTREGADLGLAIANNSDQSATYSISATDSTGNTVGTTTLQVAARTSTAKFIDQLMTFPANFYGQVIVSSTTAQASIIGLRFTGSVFTTIPQTIRN